MTKARVIQTERLEVPEFREIPKVGQLWKETWRFAGEVRIKHHRFLAAFTGKAYELLHENKDADDKRTMAWHTNTFFTHHELRGRPVTFMWANIKSESFYPDDIEITLQIPKKLAPAILGKNTRGFSLWGKVQRDVMKMYNKKAAKLEARP